jgi:ABC-type uncharacterized transport system substrate-binding protein
MMRRLGTGLVWAAAVALSARVAWGADVVVLKSTDVPAWRASLDALRSGVSKAHPISEFDLRGDRTEGERIIASLRGRPVVFVAMGPLATQIVKDLAPESPLVFCMVQDPQKFGLPGTGNAAGVAFTLPLVNQLAAFHMVDPRRTRIGVIYSRENLGRLMQGAARAAATVHLNLVERTITSERDVPEVLRALLKGDEAVDAIWIPPDPLLLGDETRRFILSESLKAAKPIFTSIPALVLEGALVSHGPDFASIGESAAELVNRLASGEKGNKIDMMIPRPELIINKKIADRLKVEIPPAALQAATKVF